jgi:hypothetical protein
MPSLGRHVERRTTILALVVDHVMRGWLRQKVLDGGFITMTRCIPKLRPRHCTVPPSSCGIAAVSLPLLSV